VGVGTPTTTVVVVAPSDSSSTCQPTAETVRHGHPEPSAGRRVSLVRSARTPAAVPAVSVPGRPVAPRGARHELGRQEVPRQPRAATTAR
jgi:hypothetical protein